MSEDITPTVIMPPYPGNSFPSPSPEPKVRRLMLPPKQGNAFAQQKEAKRLRDLATSNAIAYRAAQDPESTPTPARFASPAIRHTEVDVPSTIEEEEPVPTAATTWSAICPPDTTQDDRRNAEARKQLEELQADARARLFQYPLAEAGATTNVLPSLFGRFRNKLNNKGKNKPLPSHPDAPSDVYTASPRHFVIPSPTPALTLSASCPPSGTVPTLLPTTQDAREPSGTTFDTASSRYLSVRNIGGLGNSAMITAQPLRNQFTTPTRFGTYASNGRGQLVAAPSFNSMVGSVSVAELANRSVVDTVQGGEEEVEDGQEIVENVIVVKEGGEDEEGLAGLRERMARIERKLDKILVILEE